MAFHPLLENEPSFLHKPAVLNGNEKRSRVSRRDFLGIAATASVSALGGCSTLSAPIPGEIIDTHTHFYDPTRPQGVPWPPKEDSLLYRRVMPEDLKPIAQPHGVMGTVVVEASPWVEDNQWVLDLAGKDPFILGLVGHLKPGQPEFAKHLTRFAAQPFFRGIRTGLWGVQVTPANGEFIRDLRVLAEKDLSLDLLIGPTQLQLAREIAEAAPDLRIIIDHCANVAVNGKTPPDPWTAGIRALAPHKKVFMKVSSLVEGTGQPGKAPRDVEYYRPTLDIIWNAFGEDRVVFGSNWPVSARFADYATVLQIVSEYFRGHGPQALAKYQYLNARRAYKLRRR